MPKKTLFLILALAIVISVLLTMAISTSNTPPAGGPTRNQTIITPKETIEQTILSPGNPSIATSSSNLPQSINPYSLPISINTFKNKVTAVQLELQYDPKILTNVTVVPGSFFVNPIVLLNQIDIKTGRISYAFGIGPIGQAVIGKGTVANITFTTKVKTAEKTSILFLPTTLVTAEGINKSVLKQAINALFVVPIESNLTPTGKSSR